MNSNYTNDNALTILRDNITRLVNDERNHTSMRNLSVAIERDESYIQKFLDGKFIPSFDAIIDIANFFDLPVYELFIDPASRTFYETSIQHRLPLIPDDRLSDLQALCDRWAVYKSRK